MVSNLIYFILLIQHTAISICIIKNKYFKNIVTYYISYSDWFSAMLLIFGRRDTFYTVKIGISVTIQNGWNNRISYGCVYAQIRSGLGMHLGTYSNHDTVLFLLIVPIKGRFV